MSIFPNGIKYFTKKERKEYGIKDRKPPVEQPATKEEKIVTKFLKEQATEVLKAASQGYTVAHLPEARKLISLLK